MGGGECVLTVRAYMSLHNNHHDNNHHDNDHNAERVTFCGATFMDYMEKLLLWLADLELFCGDFRSFILEFQWQETRV